MTAVFDTNILIDFLNGVAEARREIERRRDRAISVVTWIEVLAGAQTEADQQTARTLLARFRYVDVTPAIAAHAVEVRRERIGKLPDAIIMATTQHLGGPLVTRNTRDFPESDPLVVVPYRL